jgi:hypothetical protein
MAIVNQLSASTNSIVNHAKGLADVVGANFPTYDDLVSSLNESWKDLYETLTDSSTDYFVTLALLSVGSNSTSAPLNPNEFLVALPNDFYKLAFLDYNYNGSWQRMQIFAKDNRASNPSTPLYRFQGNQLWVIGGMWNSPTFQVRIAYYPIPATLYFPNQTQTFISGLTDFQQTQITSLFYIPGPLSAPFNQNVNPAPGAYNGLAFVQQGTGISFISNSTGVVTPLLVSAAALSNPIYYKGVFYWIQAGNIYGSIFNPAIPALLTPVQMTVSNTVTFMEIYLNTIYFVDSTTTKSSAVPSTPASITGVAVTLPFTPPASVKAYSFVNSLPYWLDAANHLFLNNASFASIGTITAVVADSTHLFVVIANSLYRLTFDYTVPALPVLFATELIASDVSLIADPFQNYIPVFGLESQQIYAYSTFPDMTITYPNNLAYELISYQIAMDIKRKQSDAEGGEIIKERFTSLYTRFLDQTRRDDYYPDRISNNRSSGSPGGLLGIDF